MSKIWIITEIFSLSALFYENREFGLAGSIFNIGSGLASDLCTECAFEPRQSSYWQFCRRLATWMFPQSEQERMIAYVVMRAIFFLTVLVALAVAVGQK